MDYFRRAEDLSPEERNTEIAAILAQGILRFQHKQNQQDFGQDPLELPDETVLSVTNG